MSTAVIAIIIAVVVLVVLAAFFGGVLGFAAVRFKVEGNPIVDQINSLLPQTQCGQCSYPAANPTPKPLPMATKSTSALQAVKVPFRHWPTY